jgi:putative salt-induced outer membrane protein YdiY
MAIGRTRHSLFGVRFKVETLMKVNRLAVVIFVVSMLLIAENVMADEIRLKNGNRITGTVKKMEDKVLIFETSYAGEISIKWDEIAAVTTDSPIEMVLHDNTSFLGSMEPAPEGQIELQLVDETVERLAIDLSEVKAINPTPPEHGLKIEARLNIGVKIETGNTDKEEYDVDGKVSLRSEKNRFSFFGEYELDKADGDKTAEKSKGYGKYDRFLSKKFYIYGSTFFETDVNKDLDLRLVPSVGPGYQFYETELTNLSVELGPAYVIEKYDESDDDEYIAGQSKIDFDHYLFKKIFQFFHIDFLVLSFEDTSDIFILSRTGIRMHLYKYFNLTAQWTWEWDNDPAPGDGRSDNEYILSVGVQY